MGIDWESAYRSGETECDLSEGEYLAMQQLCDDPSGDRECGPIAGAIVDYRTDPDAWVTKDGRSILISQMGDRHLLNTMRLIRRKVHANWPQLKKEIREAAAAGVTFYSNPATMRAVQKGPEAFIQEHPKFQGMYVVATGRKLDLSEFGETEEPEPVPYDAWWNTGL